MKTRLSLTLFLAIGVASLLAWGVAAQEPHPASLSPDSTISATSAWVQVNADGFGQLANAGSTLVVDHSDFD